MKRKTRLIVALAVTMVLAALAVKAPALVRAFAGPDEDVMRLLEVLSRIKENYVEEVPTEDLLKGALEGMVESLDDPYSAYLTAAEYRDFKASTSGTFGGVGVVITNQDGYVTVVSPIKGTPGERAGLRPGDRIVAVDEHDVRAMDVDAASRLIIGEPGTEVVLEIERDKELFEVTIVREIIEVNPVEWELLPGDIGYISLTSFNEHAGDRLREAIDQLDKQKVRGLVLDLRGNPGGLMNQALEVAKEFVPAGPIVYVKERGLDQERALNSKLKRVRWPLVVLVDEGSASAAEIVAGAVQDSGSGVLVGDRTFGKATVQDIFPLSDGGALKITIGRYLTPSGRDINKEGIVPDVTVPAPDIRRITPLILDRTLAPGTGGLDVAELQRRLQTLGYDTGDVDGIYQGDTVAAIRLVQAEAGLAGDGIVDRQIVELINGKLAAAAGQDVQLDKALEVLGQMLKGTWPAAAPAHEAA